MPRPDFRSKSRGIKPVLQGTGFQNRTLRPSARYNRRYRSAASSRAIAAHSSSSVIAIAGIVRPAREYQ